MGSRAVLALTFSYFVTLIPGSRAAEDLELLPKWNAGEIWKYEMKKSRQRIKGGKTIMDVGTRTRVEIEVLQADEKGFVLRWTQGGTAFDNPEHAKNPVVRAMVDLVKDLKIELVVDKEGSLEGVRNWRDLKKKTFEILELMTAEMTKAGVPKATVDGIRGMVEPLVSSEESIALFFTREPGLLLVPLGHVYSPGKTIPFIDEVPNPFGGDSFPTKSVIKLERIEAGTGNATIRMKQTLDPAQLNRILEKTMNDLARRVGKPVPPGQELPEFNMEDEAEFAVEPKTGRVISVSHSRITKTSGFVQKETVILKSLAK
jgi:hypothetical protein